MQKGIGLSLYLFLDHLPYRERDETVPAKSLRNTELVILDTIDQVFLLVNTS